MGALSGTAGIDNSTGPTVERWTMPTDADEFLAVLEQSPALGKTDAERVRAFGAFPASLRMPLSLRIALANRGLELPVE